MAQVVCSPSVSASPDPLVDLRASPSCSEPVIAGFVRWWCWYVPIAHDVVGWQHWLAADGAIGDALRNYAQAVAGDAQDRRAAW
jgi:hypothetical protein